MNASHVERSTVLKTVCVCVCVCVCSKHYTEVNVEVPTSVLSPLSSQNPGTQSLQTLEHLLWPEHTLCGGNQD